MSNNYSASNTRENHSATGAWTTGLLIGLLGGTALALLTTSKSGQELRDTLKDQARTIPSKTGDLIDKSLDLYASALNYMQLLVEDQTLRLKRAVAAGKLAAAKKREELEMGGPSVLPFQHR